MDDSPDPGDVDAHPERGGRHHDLNASGGEVVLDAPPHVRRLPPVVAGDGELGGQLLGRGDGADVDESLLPGRSEQAAEPIALGSFAAATGDRERQRRPIESADRDEGMAQPQAARDIGSDLWRRGRSEAGPRRPATGCDRRGQKSVIRAEVMAPRRDAMRLVDHDPPDAQLGEPAHEARAAQPLGREKKQPVIARDGPPEALALLSCLHRRIDERGRHAAIRKAVDLVLHQRDERRDHHRQPALDDGRHPVADALAGASRRDRQHVAAAKHRLHHCRLSRPECIQAEDVPQRAFGPVDHLRESDGMPRCGHPFLNETPPTN